MFFSFQTVYLKLSSLSNWLYCLLRLLWASHCPFGKQIGSRWDWFTQGETLLPILSHHPSCGPSHTHDTNISDLQTVIIQIFKHLTTQSRRECWLFYLQTHNSQLSCGINTTSKWTHLCHYAIITLHIMIYMQPRSCSINTKRWGKKNTESCNSTDITDRNSGFAASVSECEQDFWTPNW